MENNFNPNYIKCPDCKNILDLSFIDNSCPNPLCGFNFDGLRAYLNIKDDKLHNVFVSVYKDRESREYKLIVTAIKYNMGNYLAHFIECNWGAHYNTLYNEFILHYLDDLNILKKVLKSDVVRENGNLIVSKNGYKMFWELYCRLKKAANTIDLRNFLMSEFPVFHRKHYREWIEKRDKRMKEKRSEPQQKTKLF